MAEVTAMHTIQTALCFSLVFTVLCGLLSMTPGMYERTRELAGLSVACQEEENTKDAIFEIKVKESGKTSWKIQISCPEKAYRLGKGVRDSLKIFAS